MTINEATRQGITELCLPQWNKYAHLTIDLVGNGHRGPWAHLIDPFSNHVCGKSPQHTKDILLLKLDEKWMDHFSDWMLTAPSEVWVPSIDPNDAVWERWQKPEDYDNRIAELA